MQLRYSALPMFVLGLQASAQMPFPDSAATWVNTRYNVSPFPPPAQYYLQDVNSYCASGADTVINAMMYTKLEFCEGGYKGAFRGDSGAVRYVPGGSTQEVLLFDFGMAVGDTATVYYEEIGQPSTALITVNQLLPHPDFPDRMVTYLDLGAQWIEGIGPAWGLFTEPWINVSNYALFLECMSHGDTLLYPVLEMNGVCALNVGTTEQQPVQTLAAYPNPARDRVHVNCGTAPVPLALFSLDGRAVPVAISWTGATAVLDLMPLRAGTYVLRSSKGAVRLVHAD
ncbi:MAG: T9SS type A sorting domain-containing protein [Flavobacteriales bacterium]